MKHEEILIRRKALWKWYLAAKSKNKTNLIETSGKLKHEEILIRRKALWKWYLAAKSKNKTNLLETIELGVTRLANFSCLHHEFLWVFFFEIL